MRERPGIEPADLELIAALADGRLSGGERNRALERIEADEGLREVLAETLRFREEEARAEGTVSALPSRGGPSRGWLLSAAAAAALAAVALVWWRPGAGGKALDVAWLGEELAAPGLGERLAGGWYEQGWSVTRGPAPEAEAAGAVIPFRVGVRAMDLEAALRGGRSADAALLTERLQALLASVELAEPQSRSYAEARGALGAGDAAGALELARVADRLNSDHPGFDAAAYELGKWAEAGRLAATAGNEDLLRSRRFRRGLDAALERGLGPGAEPAVRELREGLGRPPGELDIEGLQRAFARLIALH